MAVKFGRDPYPFNSSSNSKPKASAKTIVTPTAANIKKDSSVIVQVDKETADYLKIIRDSISAELKAGLEKLSTSSESSRYDPEKDIKKLNGRIDELTEMTEDLDSKLTQISRSIAELTTLIKKSIE